MERVKKDGKSNQGILEEKKKENAIFNKETGRVTLSNYRFTDIPTNTKVLPPRPANGNKEIKIQEQCNRAKVAFNEYREKNCYMNANLKRKKSD